MNKYYSNLIQNLLVVLAVALFGGVNTTQAQLLSGQENINYEVDVYQMWFNYDEEGGEEEVTWIFKAEDSNTNSFYYMMDWNCCVFHGQSHTREKTGNVPLTLYDRFTLLQKNNSTKGRVNIEYQAWEDDSSPRDQNNGGDDRRGRASKK